MKNQIDNLKKLDTSKYIHAANYIQKYSQWNDFKEPQQEAFNKLLPEYFKFLDGNFQIAGCSDSDIKKRTNLLNNYFDFINSNAYDNIFTSQSKFRSTIMEEFMYLLFNNLIEEIKKKVDDKNNLLKIGGAKAYTNLYFKAGDLKEFINKPDIGINSKNQDFAIYRPINLNIENVNVQANLPVVSIENKTYIDKTMLEGSIATAEKVKSGNPYSLFLIVTETYEVDLRVDPAYSRIDQIYVLRKSSKRKEDVNPIYSDVIIDLVKFVRDHLERKWSDIENKMRNQGKIL